MSSSFARYFQIALQINYTNWLPNQQNENSFCCIALPKLSVLRHLKNFQIRCVEWNSIVPLICISLLTRETEYLFYVFTGLLYFSSVHCILYLAHFLTGNLLELFLFFTIFRRYLYIQDTSLVSYDAMEIFEIFIYYYYF